MAAVAAGPAAAAELPTFEQVRAAHRPSDIPLLDRHGEVIQWHRADTTVRRGPWVSLAETSPALREAIVLSEDRRFWAHGGVDWRSLAASAWANAWNRRTRGASTVTMQLAGLLDEELARPAGGRDLGAKLGQIVRARELEARWSKTQILEAYLNAVPLRGELVGIGAAAPQLFGKHASGLDHQEAAVLAVLVRAPNAAAEVVARRACDVLRLQARPAAQDAQAPAASTTADPCAGVATTAA
ncbi:MAG: transglycosylase domain-containing protein, partial [Rubrivivax sp.]|nr:transglycosylase domain-containing protein [Rubrivivax sp.]